jgi:hypothetical protein
VQRSYVQQPPPGYNAYLSPAWVSFVYPETWVRVIDEVPGDIVFATESFGLYKSLPAEGAAFRVMPYDGGGQSPLPALFEFYHTNIGGDIVENFAPLTINGQEGATVAFSVPGEDGDQLMRLTLLSSEGRYALVLSAAGSAYAERYAGVFDQMLQSLVIGQAPPPLAIDRAGGPPPGYVRYADPQRGVALAYPPGWEVMDHSDGLALLPPGEDPLDAQNRVDVGMTDEFAGDAGATAAAILDTAFYRGLFMTHQLDDFVLIGELDTAAVGDQDIAEVLVAGTIDDEPVLTLLEVVSNGDNAAFAAGLLRDEEAYRADVEAILNTVTVSRSTFTPVGEVVPLTIGQQLDVAPDEDLRADYAFTATVGQPLLIVFRQGGEEINVPSPNDEGWLELYDPDGRRVDKVIAGSSLVELLEVIPQQAGTYHLTARLQPPCTEPHSCRSQVLVIEPRPGAPGIVEEKEVAVSADKPITLTFDGLAGELVVAAAKPAASGNLNVYVGLSMSGPKGNNEMDLDPSFSPEVDWLSGDPPECGDDVFDCRGLDGGYLKLPADGTYTVQIDTREEQPIPVQLFIFKAAS